MPSCRAAEPRISLGSIRATSLILVQEPLHQRAIDRLVS